jgi:hypothetical protein
MSSKEARATVRKINVGPGDTAYGTSVHVAFSQESARTGLENTVSFASGAQMRNLPSECRRCPFTNPVSFGEHLLSCTWFQREKNHVGACISIVKIADGVPYPDEIPDPVPIAKTAGARCLQDDPLFPVPQGEVRNPHRPGNRN